MLSTGTCHTGREGPSRMENHLGGEVLISVEEAARRLNISRSTLYLLIQRGELQSIKIGASRRVPVAALDEFVARQRELQGATG